MVFTVANIFKGGNMKSKVFILLLCISILSGCVKESDNTYRGVYEKDTTEKYVVQQTTTAATNDDSIEKEDAKKYIDDSHFYDDTEGVDFASFEEEKENYHIRILNAFISDNLEDFGDYFCEDNVKGDIEYAKNFCIERLGYDADDLTYMCVQVELTNNSNENAAFPVSHSLRWYSRVEDIRGKEWDLADKRIEYLMPYTELWYDSPKKEDGVQNYYSLLLSAGETVTTKCVYVFDKKCLENELYLCLHLDEGEENIKYNCIFPPTAKTTKFLKINLQEK